MQNKDKQRIFDFYRVKIVKIEQVTDFESLEREISNDEEVSEMGLTEELVDLLARHRTHMLNQIDEAIMNY